MAMPPVERHAIGAAKLDLLEAAGYVWDETISWPGTFRHPITGRSTTPPWLDCSFSKLAMLTAQPKP